MGNELIQPSRPDYFGPTTKPVRPQSVSRSQIELGQMPLVALKTMPPALIALAGDAGRFITDALKKQGVVFFIENKLVPAEQLLAFLTSKGLSPQQQGAIALHLYSSIDNGSLPLPSTHGAPVIVNEPVKQMAANPIINAKFVAGLERAEKQKSPMALLRSNPNASKENNFQEPHKAYSDPVRFKTAPPTAPHITRIAQLNPLLEGAGIPKEIATRALKELEVLNA